MNILPFLKNYEIGSKHVIFGVGNHMWMNSRHSIGLKAMDRFAQHLGFKWIKSQDMACSYIETRRFIFAKAETYNAHENVTALRYLLEAFPNSTLDNITIVHHDMHVPLGAFRTGVQSRIKGNIVMENLTNLLKSESMRKCGIGIAPSFEDKFKGSHILWFNQDAHDKLYCYNKFSDQQMALIEKNIFNNLDYTLRCILNRKRNVRSDRDPNNPLLANVDTEAIPEDAFYESPLQPIPGTIL